MLLDYHSIGEHTAFPSNQLDNVLTCKARHAVLQKLEQATNYFHLLHYDHL